jgi:hypothetical protein
MRITFFSKAEALENESQGPCRANKGFVPPEKKPGRIGPTEV